MSEDGSMVDQKQGIIDGWLCKNAGLLVLVELGPGFSASGSPTAAFFILSN